VKGKYMYPKIFGQKQLSGIKGKQIIRNVFWLIFIDLILRKLLELMAYIYHRSIKPTFRLNSRIYNYWFNKYNKTYANERSVEIALGLTEISQHNHESILELGCVLPHYTKCNWRVIDKFEIGKGIINEDILQYKSDKKFDLIICLSTLEHIGIDDSVVNPKLSVQALDKLKSLLSSSGKLLITVPAGYNSFLDDYLIHDQSGLTECLAMKRLTPWNTWKQVPVKRLLSCKYGWPYNNANGLIVGILDNALRTV
jgi:hypothetical protein